MRFSFIGDFRLDESNIRRGNTKNGDPYISINPFIIASVNNRGRCELFGMKRSVIKTKDTTGGNIDINWEDRKDPDVIKDVAQYRKITISFGGKRHEFISEYDANEFIVENMAELNGKRMRASGNVQKDFYNGNVRDRYVISNLSEVVETAEKKYKNSLLLTGVVYWDKAGIDTTEFADTKKVYVDGYTSEYISEEKANRYVASRFTLDCSKINIDDKEQFARMEAMLAELGLAYKAGKIVNNVKAKAYAANDFIINLINGAEEVEFTIDDCTEKQKLWIELGLKTLEELKPSGNIYGAWVVEYKIKAPTMKGDYSDGMIYIDEKPSEFEENIYIVMKDEKIDDLPFEDAMNEPEEVPDEEDLFD